MIKDIFKQIAASSTIGKLYYFADRVNGEFVIKSGKEDLKLFPLEKNYGFFYIKKINHNEHLIDNYEMTFYYFYESNFNDKMEKLLSIKAMLYDLASKVDSLTLLRSNINNDEILADFRHEQHHGNSEKKLIKIDFNLAYDTVAGC